MSRMKTVVIVAIGFFLAGVSLPSITRSEDSGRLIAQNEAAGKPAASEQAKEKINVGNKFCPVTGEKIDEQSKATYEYKGKIYNFCCEGCISDFKKDPEKYIEKINNEKAGTNAHDKPSCKDHH